MSINAQLALSAPEEGPSPRPAASAICLAPGDCPTLMSDKVRHMHDWWMRAAGGQPPFWSQFDITDHARIVANTFLVKRLGARSWFYTVKGEAVHALFPSYKTPHEIAQRKDTEEANQLINYYEEVAATGCCHLVCGTLENERNQTIEFEAIDCPFREEESGRIAILGVIEMVRVRTLYLV